MLLPAGEVNLSAPPCRPSLRVARRSLALPPHGRDRRLCPLRPERDAPRRRGPDRPRWTPGGRDDGQRPHRGRRVLAEQGAHRPGMAATGSGHGDPGSRRSPGKTPPAPRPPPVDQRRQPFGERGGAEERFPRGGTVLRLARAPAPGAPPIQRACPSDTALAGGPGFDPPRGRTRIHPGGLALRSVEPWTRKASGRGLGPPSRGCHLSEPLAPGSQAPPRVVRLRRPSGAHPRPPPPP